MRPAAVVRDGRQVLSNMPAQFDQWIRTEIERWSKIIRTQRIALE